MGTNKKRARRRRGRRVLSAFALLACIAGAACFVRLGAQELMERQAGDDFYAALAARVEAEAAVLADETPRAAQSGGQAEESLPADGGPSAEDGDLPAPEESAGPAASAAQDGAPVSAIDFGAIWETCPDVVGWLRIEGTVIDYPIVQGEDNEFYLNHLADGTQNSAGSIMLDQANSGDFSDGVSILHGHHMRSGSMFGDLDEYGSEDYYREHPVIRLYTPAGDCDVAVFAAYTVDGYAFGYPTSFADEASFDSFVRRAVSATGYETGVTVEYGDRMLLLSTCAYSFEGARFVVLGKIIEPD